MSYSIVVHTSGSHIKALPGAVELKDKLTELGKGKSVVVLSEVSKDLCKVSVTRDPIDAIQYVVKTLRDWKDATQSPRFVISEIMDTSAAEVFDRHLCSKYGSLLVTTNKNRSHPKSKDKDGKQPDDTPIKLKVILTGLDKVLDNHTNRAASTVPVPDTTISSPRQTEFFVDSAMSPRELEYTFMFGFSSVAAPTYTGPLVITDERKATVFLMKLLVKFMAGDDDADEDYHDIWRAMWTCFGALFNNSINREYSDRGGHVKRIDICEAQGKIPQLYAYVYHTYRDTVRGFLEAKRDRGEIDNVVVNRFNTEQQLADRVVPVPSASIDVGAMSEPADAVQQTGIAIDVPAK